MLNNTFLGADGDGYVLGDRCHQQSQKAVPVWVVTDLNSNLLLTNDTGWKVTSGRITINRLFQASTAMIVCTATNLDADGIYPELPTNVARSRPYANGKSVYQLEDKDYPLDKADEIAIWCGYIPEKRAVKDDDITGGNLIRRFVGVIDTIYTVGSATQGVSIVIQCRDRMKYLMDSIGTFNTTDFNPLKDSKGGSDIANDGTIKRSDVIIELARRCIGHLENAASLDAFKASCGAVGGTRIQKGYVKEYIDKSTYSTATLHGIYTNINASPIGLDKTDSDPPFIGGATRTTTFSLQPDPVMNIISGRLPYRLADKEGQLDLGTAGYHTITDRAPVEFIKFLSLQEPWPTEFFSDARTGEYWYAPRGLDKTGLIDKRRFFRTYFFRYAPSNALVEISKRSKVIAEQLANKSNDVGTFTASRATIALVTAALPDSLDQDTYSLKVIKKPEGKYELYTSKEATVYSVTKADIDRWIDDFYNLGPGARETGINLINKILVAAAIDSGNLANRTAEGIKAFYKDKFNTLDTRQEATIGIAEVNEKKIANAIHSAQAMLFFREESSAINWRSNIIISNQPVGAASDQSAVHIMVKPKWLENRNFPVSYFNAVDTTIGNNQAELIAVAMSYARLYGKELKSASMHILGDPSLTPGELIQTIGSPLHPKVLDKEWLEERSKVLEYIEGYDALHRKLLEGSVVEPNTTQNDGDETTPPPATTTPATGPTVTSAGPKDQIESLGSGLNVVSAITATQAAMMCPAFFGAKNDKEETPTNLIEGFIDFATETGTPTGGVALPQTAVTTAPPSPNTNNIQFPEDPKTMWRVEAIIDKFNEQPGSGYRTEVALLSPF